MRRVAAYRALARMLGPQPAHAFEPAPQPDDWKVLIAVATHALVAPALHPALARAGLLERVPADVATYLLALTEMNARRNALLLRDVLHVARLLNGAGIVPRLLKGASILLGEVHPDAAERVVGDLDVLVAPAELARAQQCLLDDGYRSQVSEPARHHVAPLAHPDRLGVVELHFRILASERGGAFLEQVAAALGRPWLVRERDGATVRVPAPTLHLAHRFGHDMAQEPGFIRGWLSLRGMHDAWRLAAGCGEPVAWDLLAAGAAAHGLRHEWQVWCRALARYFGLARELPAATLFTQLWHGRVLMHQQWPWTYHATRWMFQRARRWLPRRWLRYWGW